MHSEQKTQNDNSGSGTYRTHRELPMAGAGDVDDNAHRKETVPRPVFPRGSARIVGMMISIFTDQDG
jgi:hypothetical protein